MAEKAGLKPPHHYIWTKTIKKTQYLVLDHVFFAIFNNNVTNIGYIYFNREKNSRYIK